MTTTTTTTRSVATIAHEIIADWKKPYFGAVPYLQAMCDLESVSDSYGYDAGREIVLRFLCNAQTWRGETAKRIKAELKVLLADKSASPAEPRRARDY